MFKSILTAFALSLTLLAGCAPGAQAGPPEAAPAPTPSAAPATTME